jgi:hypothetical protein
MFNLIDILGDKNCPISLDKRLVLFEFEQYCVRIDCDMHIGAENLRLVSMINV